MNSVNLVGRLTKSIELRKTRDNKSVVEFSIAINSGYGENKKANFINIVAWDFRADYLSKYSSVGCAIAVEGELRTDSYEKDGKKIYKTYVLANSVELLNNKKTSIDEIDEELGNRVIEELKQGNADESNFGATIQSEQLNLNPDDLPFY